MIQNLQEIKERSDIVAIIQRNVDLQKAGASYKGCCPFHEEKSPSFTVSARKQAYHCFGCGASGDVFEFVAKHLRVEFVEAVEYVAKESGVRVEYAKGRETARKEYEESKSVREGLQAINEDVLQFYFHRTWWIPPFVFDQINVDGRTYTPATIDAFKLCVTTGNSLYQASLDKRFKLEDLKSAGLVHQSEKTGGYYDHFIDRTLFPIRDQQGRVAGFTGRKLADGDPKIAKYKNSQDGPAFNKSKLLYGLYENGAHIARTNSVYVVEGPHDMLTMWENGIRNAVATNGTALTVDHAKILARFADNVTLLFDGDSAGQKAANRAIDVLVGHVAIKVAVLPDGLDPCDFIRQRGNDEFFALVATEAKDAITWAIMADWSKEDLDAQKRCYEVAGRLLSKMSEINREIYIKELTRRTNMGAVKKLLTDHIDEYLADNAPKSAFSREQQDSISRYGVYQSERKYFVPIDDGKGVPISNFYIKSMLLIYGNNINERIVEIENVNGYKVIDRIPSEKFTDLGQFKSWVESRGHFILKIKPEQWTNIRDMVYEKMITSYPITVLGYHKEGFYTFRNGVFDGDIFQPCDDRGVVQVGSDHYILTMAASMGVERADDGADTITNATFLTYQRPNHSLTLTEWYNMLTEAYGPKTMAAMAYYMAALFRDIVFDAFTYFPHLNVFGVKGTGKNYFIESIMSAFGRVEAPTDLTSATDKALPRVMAGVRNALVWFDEYKNDLSPDVISVLRGAYGASGRTTANKTLDNSTVRFQPRSGIIISGEHRPTRDIALYSRCLALETKTASFTPEQSQITQRLKQLEQTGCITSITLSLLKHREAFAKGFYNQFLRVQRDMHDVLRGGRVESRILNNWCVVLAAGETLREAGVEIPWDYWVFLDFCYERVLYQSNIVNDEDHLATFWRMVAFLLEDHKIQHNEDIVVQKMSAFKIAGDSSRDLKNYETPDKQDHTFIFIRLTRIHQLYLNIMAQQRGAAGLGLGTLEHYMRNSPWWIGKTKKRFSGDAQWCYAFKPDAAFPVDFSLTKDVNTSPFDE